jgi:transcriptional repressor NrdR
VQLREIIVVKKNGEKKIFDPEKLKKSIEMAVRKRPVSGLQVEKLVNNIVRQLEIDGDFEIASSKIGEIVMLALEKLDKVAFVRFASVYKNFEKPDDFQKFIKGIVNK